MERMTQKDFKAWLEGRTKDFAVAVFKVLDAMPKKNSTAVIAYQLGKSASSIGANYSEANRSESGDDFRHKVSIALKEASETVYWLEILHALYPMHDLRQDTPFAGDGEQRRIYDILTQNQRSKGMQS